MAVIMPQFLRRTETTVTTTTNAMPATIQDISRFVATSTVLLIGGSNVTCV